jgi:hypothetical protein
MNRIQRCSGSLPGCADMAVHPSRPLLRPRVTVLGRSVSSFHVCGVCGLSLGLSLALVLAHQAQLSQSVVVILFAMGLFTFLALAMATKIVTGHESLVYYHHEVAILSTSTVLLAGLGLPVLPYLDVTALGLGVFLACGRCGCLMVGCCHGKPFWRGVLYGYEHAAEGFPAWYVGARLFPVQALESIIVLSIVLAGSLMVLHGKAAGTALSWYVVTYSAARIWLEELRGDTGRPYWLRLSEAQWTSLLLILGIVSSEWIGRLPFSLVHTILCTGAAASLIIVAVRRPDARAIVHPHHGGEIAGIVAGLPLAPGMAGVRRPFEPVSVRRTSLTVGVSTERLGRLGESDASLYSLSRLDRDLTTFEARALARLILNLAPHPRATDELVRGPLGVFHVIVRETSNRAGDDVMATIVSRSDA